MSNCGAPKLAKWPFVVADVVLAGLAIWMVYRLPHPLNNWQLLCLVGCVAGAAWAGVTPFLVEHRAAVRFAESSSLTTAVDQINNLRNLANQISFATAQWQVVQEHSGKTVEEARGIADKMAVEARAFTDFMTKANDSEKAYLRLESEKLHRAEGEWLQVVVRLLDQVFALHRAAMQSGQPNLMEQITRFQDVCRDAARRVGLIPYEAAAEEAFNEETHQLVEAESKAPAGARVGITVAPGYTFQGRPIRRAVVHLGEPAVSVSEAEEQVPLGTA